MCSPCYNNSIQIACPANPWCGTAGPGQVNSCLTECSSYGLAPQARPRPYPRPCIFSWLLSVYPQLLHLAYHLRKNIPCLYSTENHQGCKKKSFFYLACLPLVLQLSFIVPNCLSVCITPFLTIRIFLTGATKANFVSCSAILETLQLVFLVAQYM